MEKSCSKCLLIKNIDLYPKQGNICKTCIKIYKQNNKDKNIIYNRKYNETHKEIRKRYKQNNKNKINEYQKNRRANDPNYRLRSNISRNINRTLVSTGKSKNGESFLKYLPYSIEELKEHLEKQLETWMTWDNHENYNIEIWNDNDPTTWTWQVDHIIPHSTFKYTSMEDDEFKRCWALNNLRPYSAKYNLLDGTRRVRH